MSFVNCQAKGEKKIRKLDLCTTLWLSFTEERLQESKSGRDASFGLSLNIFFRRQDLAMRFRSELSHVFSSINELILSWSEFRSNVHKDIINLREWTKRTGSFFRFE